MTKILRASSIVSILLIFASLAIIYIYFANSDNAVIIRVDTYKNISFLGTKNDILKIAVTGLSLVFANIFLARLTEKKYLFLSRILAFGNVLFALLILIVVNVIMLLN